MHAASFCSLDLSADKPKKLNFFVKAYSQIQNEIDAVGGEVPPRVEHKIMGIGEDLSKSYLGNSLTGTTVSQTSNGGGFGKKSRVFCGSKAGNRDF